MLHECACSLRILANSDLKIHQACRPVDGDIQVAFLFLVGHLGQMFDIAMHVAVFVVLEGLCQGFLSSPALVQSVSTLDAA